MKNNLLEGVSCKSWRNESGFPKIIRGCAISSNEDIMEFPWRKEALSTADPVLGPPPLITKDMVVKSICKMKNRKASGTSGVVTEMLKASSDICSKLIADLAIL